MSALLLAVLLATSEPEAKIRHRWFNYDQVLACRTQAAAEYLARMRRMVDDASLATHVTEENFREEGICTMLYATQFRIIDSRTPPHGYTSPAWVIFKVMTKRGDEYYIEMSELRRR